MSAVTLTDHGLWPGAQVRWQHRPQGKWCYGYSHNVEADGSIAITALNGAARSIRADRLELRAKGPRGGTIWRAPT